MYMVGVLYMDSGSRALVGDIRNVSGNTARQCIHEWETQEGSIRQEQGSRNLGSCGEAMKAMLQGLMSSKVELGMGGQGRYEKVWN